MKGTGHCANTNIVNIECRTVRDKIPSKETGMDVECSLERGLVCKTTTKPCTDFEIRVLCECGRSINLCILVFYRFLQKGFFNFS